MILTYYGIEIDRAELISNKLKRKNPRLATLEERIGEFAKSLTDPKDKYFESKVALLFHLLGFATAHYGKAYTDNPDILAFATDKDWLLEIECTEQSIDLNSKLSKLATRTKILGSKLNQMRVYPILVTKLSQDHLNKTDVEKAQAENISVLTSDDFRSLLTMALDCSDLEKVLDYVTRFRYLASQFG